MGTDQFALYYMTHPSRRSYLLYHIFEAVRHVDRIAYEDNMGIMVGKGTKALILLLTDTIPKSQFNFAVIELDVHDVGFNYRRRKHGTWEFSQGKDA